MLDSVTETRPKGGSPTRVLVIDDERDNADMLQILCEVQGFVARVAYSAADGIRVAQEYHPDVILCDIGLQDKTGYEVAAVFRADVKLRRAVILAITGFGRATDKATAAESGFDAHFTKPIDVDELFGLIRSILAARAAHRTLCKSVVTDLRLARRAVNFVASNAGDCQAQVRAYAGAARVRDRAMLSASRFDLSEEMRAQIEHGLGQLDAAMLPILERLRVG